jgi:amino acid transporter
MKDAGDDAQLIAEDVKALRRMGYAQELRRGMGAFSNYAISLSIICILAGGVTSFQMGFCSVGGAAIGVGWPLSCLLSLAVALTMGQVASAFPTAGGLYHWASILGGRGWGWVTAWFNLAGLCTVLAAVNVGAWQFAAGALGPRLGFDPPPESARAVVAQIVGVTIITLSQALVNHRGIRLTTRLTDFSGYWILLVAAALTAAMLSFARHLSLASLFTFANYSGIPAGNEVWPATRSVPWLFLLGLLLPAYTITGFDASAHTAEETIGASVAVPRGIVRSVLVSGLFGWIMLAAVVAANPDPGAAAEKGGSAFAWIVGAVVPETVAVVLYAAIAAAQYLCGLATVTSASRMAYAFARDGGLPWSGALRKVSATHQVPARAIWAISLLSLAFTLYVPVYSTISVVCTIFLYLSYVIPTALGLFAWGRTWTAMGPWGLGRWYRPVAVVAVLFCALLIVIGVQPPNDKALWILAGSVVVLAAVWLGWERKRFRGPPEGVRGGEAEGQP